MMNIQCQLAYVEMKPPTGGPMIGPISAAIAGGDVAMVVESMFSMKSATAMMRGMRRSRLMAGTQGRGGRTLFNAGRVREHCRRRKGSYLGVRTREGHGGRDDLYPGFLS